MGKDEDKIMSADESVSNGICTDGENNVDSEEQRDDIVYQRGNVMTESTNVEDVEDQLRKLVLMVQTEINNQNVATAFSLIDQGTTFARKHDSMLTQNARHLYAKLFTLKCEGLFNPFCFLTSMEQLDLAIWVSKSPSVDLVEFSHKWFADFLEWCYLFYPMFSQAIIDYFERKIRRLEKLMATDPVGSASSIIMYSAQCCKLGLFISQNDHKKVKKGTLIDLFVRHGLLHLSQNEVKEAKKFVTKAFELTGNSAKVYFLSAKVDLCLLKSMSSSHLDFMSLHRECEKHIKEGLKMDSIFETGLKKDLEELQNEFEDHIRHTGVRFSITKTEVTVETDDCPDVVKQLQRQEEIQKRKREAFQEKQAKSKAKVKLVSKHRAVTQEKPGNDEEEVLSKSEKTKKKDGKERLSSSTDKEPELKCLINTPNGIYKVNAKEMPIQPMTNPKSKLRKENRFSREVYSFIIQKYSIRLGCDLCVYVTTQSDGSQQKVMFKSDEEHRCPEDKLLLRKLSDGGKSGWIVIRPCPRRFKFGGDNCVLCESFVVGEECMEKNLCPYPHNNEELELWQKYFKSKITLQKFLDDLRETPLRVKYVVERLCESLNGVFRFVCGRCYAQSSGRVIKGKKHHSPFCENEEGQHPWNNDNQKFVFILNGDTPDFTRAVPLDNVVNDHDYDDDDTTSFDESCTSQKIIAVKIQQLTADWLASEMKISEIVEESKRYWIRREKLGTAIRDFEPAYQRVRDDSVSSSGNGSTLDQPLHSPDSDVEEDPDRIYDSDLDDVMTVHDSDEEDENCGEDDGYDEDLYYELKPREELIRLLEQKPQQFKKCLITLDGPYTAKCKVLDSRIIEDGDSTGGHCDSKTVVSSSISSEMDVLYNRSQCDNEVDGTSEFFDEGNHRTIEIRGRANCGPCFSGDEVVVELKKTKELGDNAAVVYRGTVVGILKRHTDRRAYTFLCRVDGYMAHLMRPINGIAPKIHVVHSVIKEKHYAQRNELVAKYHMEDGELKLDKIVKLDPKRRRDMLFVVKYLQWLPKCMYPLGYVTKIIESGQSLEDSQKVLNILYQVPTMPNKECREAAQELLNIGNGATKLVDIKHWYTISIDPSDCKDVDDALTIRRIGAGFEVGIHIADVSEYVEMDGVIDSNARKRVTSYYPADNKVYHMLPSELSENMCSLKENEDRLALSVFVILSRNGDLLNQSPMIRRTVIKNKRNMTYEEAQAIINHNSFLVPESFDENDEKSVLCTLHFLAKRLRQRRLNLGHLFFQDDNPFSINKCYDSHHLVEEFMVLANIQVANFLVSKFPECIPLRRQLAPEYEDLDAWFNKNRELITRSFYFSQYSCLTEKTTDFDEFANSATSFSFLSLTLEKLKMAVKRNNFQEIKTIVGNEWFHPDHALAMLEWWGIQENAEFVPIGDLGDDERDHFSLQVPHYVQFTSPIRRYMDIVIHRLVKCALDHEPSPYTLTEVRKLCNKANDVNRTAKKYHRACRLMKLTELLSTPFYLPCFLESFDDDGLTLTIPHLGKVAKSQRVLKYSAFSVNDKPEVNNEVQLLWEKRMYDADSRIHFKNYARKRQNARRVMRIESNRHVAHVNSRQWYDLMSAVLNNNENDVKKSIEGIKEDAMQEKQCRTEQTEVTSEMYNDELMVKHHVRFRLSLQRGSVLAVQLGADCCNGFLQPTIRMVNLTPEKDICVEHRTDPVKCFADLATEKVRPDYQSIDHYKSVLLPILAMEAASKTVAAGDTILCNNVIVSLRKTNDAYYGKLKLPLAFCKKRKIHIFNNSKDGEEDSNDFMCIRYCVDQDKICETKDTVCTSFVRNVWVGHAVALYVHVGETEDVVVKFRLQKFSSLPPRSFLDAGRTGVKCAVEFLTKLLPDRRMEDAVKSINESSDLCKKIVLGHRFDDLPGIIKYVENDTYDVEADASTKMYKNNKDQTDAIRKSLRGKFTLIQGPPGTGKTVTGIKTAYWYVEMNKKIRTNGGTHGQVLYCGPSNSSVDVAAKWLKKLGKNCPKIVRVYSEVLERQVFPIPRDSLQIGANLSGRRYELIDKDENKDIALHHLIRKKERKFSARIRAFDKLFAEKRDTPEEISEEKVDEYKKLITDAAISELKEYDVILCTCAASVSPRMLRSANIHQIIIDECGMCMEPETLIPLQGFKGARQIVLIGDHKQLQPIVTNSVAKNLGLDVSLFERYKDQAVMLTEQYRMHPSICEFPSIQFYDNKLKTADIHDCLNERKCTFWPNRRVPMVFCHAEGAEKVLSVSTEEGNEHSRSNELERSEAARIFFNLVNLYRVNPDKITILSQYKAQCSDIEQNLKQLGYMHPNVGTVIASQGDEWDYVILSLVRSMPQYEIEKKPSIGWCQKNMGFIIDEHQINVALTRARLGLIIIGNKHLLKCNDMWKNLLNHFERRKLIMDTDDFLPSANRLAQKPTNDDAQLYDRFGNPRPEPRQNLRDFMPSGRGGGLRRGQAGGRGAGLTQGQAGGRGVYLTQGQAGGRGVYLTQGQAGGRGASLTQGHTEGRGAGLQVHAGGQIRNYQNRSNYSNDSQSNRGFSKPFNKSNV